ncbi:unnamed protein product, partial [Iphiclides podalirius]
MRTLLHLTLLAFAAIASSISSNEKYNDNLSSQFVYNVDGKKLLATPRYSVRDDKSNRGNNQGYVARNKQPEYIASNSNSECKESTGVTNNYKQGINDNDRGDYADIWDLYHSKNLDTLRRMQSGNQDKYAKIDVATDRYKRIGRHGLGFERRTASAHGLRVPLTKDLLQVVGKVPAAVVPVAQPYPVQTYPVQPYPVQPYPVQPYPVQPYPVQPYPVQPYPVQPYPAQPYPAQPVPVQPVTVQPVPVQPVPVQPVPVQPGAAQPVPVQPIPLQPVADTTWPVYPYSFYPVRSQPANDYSQVMNIYPQGSLAQPQYYLVPISNQTASQ